MTLTATNKVIPRHQDLSESERTALKLKRSIKLQNKEFKLAQKQNRPKLNKARSLQEFGEHAEETAKALSSLALKVMSLQTAFGYAEEMIRLDIDGEGVEWDNSASLKLAEKIQTIRATEIMLKHFNVSKSNSNKIIEQTIAKQFGMPGVAIQPSAPPNTPAIPTFTAKDIKATLEAYGKELGKPE